MKDALLFNSLSSLNFLSVRENVIRIPEVSVRLSEAQEIWDSKQDGLINFKNFLVSDDDNFLSNIRLKNLVSAIVQVGLFDRYLKYYRRPQFMLGCINGDSALKVCAGIISFYDFIVKSIETQNGEQQSEHSTETFLSGVRLNEYGAFFIEETAGEQVVAKTIEVDKMDINKVLTTMIEDHGVKKIVNIGPGNALFKGDENSFALRDIQMLESIDLDPMLNWFWPSLRNQEAAALVQ